MYYVNASKFGWRNVKDDFLIYKINGMEIIWLNETSERIWRFILSIEKGVSETEIINYLSSLYEIDEFILKNDLITILDEMLNLGVIEKTL